MKLQAAANRCLGDIFLLFLKFFVLILSYPRWHLEETPSWLNYQERCGRSQESKTQKLSPTLKTLHLPDSSSCFLPPLCCVYNVPFPHSCEQFFLTWAFLDFSILPLSHRYCQSPQEPHALPGLKPHLPRSLHLPEMAAPVSLLMLFSFHNQVFSNHGFLVQILDFLVLCAGLIERKFLY